MGKKLWDNADLWYALAQAASFIEDEEWPDDDGGAQMAANKEAARRIRKIANRVKSQPGEPANG